MPLINLLVSSTGDKIKYFELNVKVQGRESKLWRTSQSTVSSCLIGLFMVVLFLTELVVLSPETSQCNSASSTAVFTAMNEMTYKVVLRISIHIAHRD
jgi:hypothetical protein